MSSTAICPDNSIWIRVFVDIDPRLAQVASSWIGNGIPLVAPSLVHYEFSHVLTRYVRNRRLAQLFAAELLDAALALDIDVIDNDDIHRLALSHSTSIPGLSGYDAQYLAVCERKGAELWTADKGLAAVSQRLGVATRLWVTAPA
jgi:predicted nucleic acid-binding protein